MMFVTLSVTDTARSTQQVEQIGVQNQCIDDMGHEGPLEDGANNIEGHRCTYAVWRGDEYFGVVLHEQSDGALVLTNLAIAKVLGE